MFRKDNHTLNSGFHRVFAGHPILSHDQMDLKYNSYYIAGLTRSGIYLGNTSSPLRFLKVPYSLKDSQHHVIQISGIENYRFRSVHLKVDSPGFLLTDGSIPLRMYGNVNEGKVNYLFKDSIPFSLSVPLNSNTIIQRSIGAGENIFVKSSIYPRRVIIKDSILEKQKEGLFSTDGQLIPVRGTGQIVHLYYYRNQFILMDSNLNVLQRGRTIDTNTHAKISTKSIESGVLINTFSSPPLIVNKKSAANGHLLFINSNLKAENEYQKFFDKAPVIDVYNLRKAGSYEFSFYLSLGGKKAIRDINIFGNKIVVIHSHYLSIFQLNPKVLN